MLYHARNPHGGDIYGDPVSLDFSANTNPFGTPQGILDAVGESLSALHRYPDPYCRALVAAIAKHEQLPESHILCGNGAAELIYAYCQAELPKKAVVLAPTFSEYALGLKSVGCQVVPYTLYIENAFTLRREFLDFLESEMPDTVFICNPNNPTGKLVDPALMERLLIFCQNRDIDLFVDECFLDLTEDGCSMKGYLNDYPCLFILKAFTKSYGMAGIRLGYGLSGNAELLQTMSAAVQPWNVSSLAQTAGVAALKEQEFLEKTKALIKEQRAWLKNQLEELGFWTCPSKANFLLFHGPLELHKALMEQGIAIRNCDNYVGLGPGWYRIAVRLPEENRLLIETIREIAERK